MRIDEFPYETLGDLVKSQDGTVGFANVVSGSLIAGEGTLINKDFVEKHSLEEGTHYKSKNSVLEGVAEVTENESKEEVIFDEKGNLIYKDVTYRKPNPPDYVSPMKTELEKTKKLLEGATNELKLAKAELEKLKKKDK